MPKLIVSSRGGSGKSRVATLLASRMAAQDPVLVVADASCETVPPVGRAAALAAEAGKPLGEPLSPDGVGGTLDELAVAVGQTLGLPSGCS